MQDLGLTDEEGELGLRYGHYLRNRFTVAKLAWLLGLYDEPATVARSGKANPAWRSTWDSTYRQLRRRRCCWTTAAATVVSAAQPYPLHSPRPLWAEQDPEDWWQAGAAAIRDVLQQSGVQGEDVAAVGLTGHMFGLVGLDGQARRSVRASCGTTSGPAANAKRSPGRSGWTG